MFTRFTFVSFILAATMLATAVAASAQNLVNQGGTSFITVEFGKHYLIEDRRGELHNMGDCKKDAWLSGGDVIYYNCKSWYEKGLVAFKGYNYAYFKHVKKDGKWGPAIEYGYTGPDYKH